MQQFRTHADSSTADVVVIGGGVIGLSTALALSDAGAVVALVADDRPGAASGAAAGLLAPSVGALTPDAAVFFLASLAAYPTYLARLRSADTELRLITGLIEIASAPSASTDLTPSQITSLEPALFAPHGGRLHASDGAIDIGRLMNALRRATTSASSIRTIASDPVIRLDAARTVPAVTLRSGRTIQARFVVLAAGAWSPSIGGLPRQLPVYPLKGQMLALESASLAHPVMGDDVYLVPRAGEIAVGATTETVGFDLTTHDDAIESLRAAAARLIPALASARESRRWAGIRPATPDMLPILGADPDQPRLIYACGHSKNGILLAPATAQSVVAITTGSAPINLSPFAATRFERTSSGAQ